MNLDIKINGFSDKLINIAVIFLCISMSLNLFTYGISQKFFYLATYVCVFLVAMAVFKKDKKIKIGLFGGYLVLSLILLGFVRVSWVYFIGGDGKELSTIAAGILDGYRLSGKRLLLGAFVVAAIILYSNRVSVKTIGFLKLIILIGMVVTLTFGLHEYYYVTHRRIKLTADAASSSSYMVIFIYCAYLWLSGFHYGKLWRFIDILFVLTVFTVMVLCGTRITFIAFILVSLFYVSNLLGWKRIINSKKNIAVAICLLGVVIAFTQARWMEAVNNIDHYSINSSTSVGARFSIWASGVSFIENNFGFSSPDERTVVSRNYIHHSDPKNRIAYSNVKYNMHNEFLEVASLQGWLGFISLLMLYVVVLVGKLKCNNIRGVGMPVAALFITGLTDSVLIYGPTAMMFVTAMAICSIKLERKHPGVDNL